MKHRRIFFLCATMTILLAWTLSGCAAVGVEVRGVEPAPAAGATAVIDPPQASGPESPARATDTYADWAQYTNLDYGFVFHYPTTWTLTEEANLLKLSRRPFLLAITFQRKGDDMHPPWSGMPAGSFDSREAPPFMGQQIDSHALTFEGKVKVLTYGAEVGDVFFAMRLDDMTTADYQAIEISEAVQGEVDQIIGSFSSTGTGDS